jgi:hypothetical protein
LSLALLPESVKRRESQIEMYRNNNITKNELNLMLEADLRYNPPFFPRGTTPRLYLRPRHIRDITVFMTSLYLSRYRIHDVTVFMTSLYL